MNPYLIFILCVLTGEFLLSSVTKWLNLKAMDPNLPDEFAGFYDIDKYRKSQEYTIDNTRFGFVVSTINIVILLLFILYGGFNWIDQGLRGYHFDSDIILGIVYFFTLFLLKDIISIPFSIYSTFVIEEKYGFNKTTPKLFILDKLKGIVLALVIGSIILGAILYFFEVYGSTAWKYAWGVMTFFIVVMPPVYINWIAPLFNKFISLESGNLRHQIEEYADKVKFPLQEIYIMDGSKRSSHSNAYFIGFGKNKRIVLYDTLLEKHSNEEIVAILAHEVGHYKKKHQIINIVMSIMFTGFMLFLLSFFINNQGLFDAFQMNQISNYAGIIFFSMFYTPINFTLGILMNILSRRNEYQADAYSKKTIGSGDPLILGLKNLTTSNLGNLTPHKLMVWMNYSHPPVLHRIRELR